VPRVELETDQPAVGGKRARQPGRAVARERADFQDVPRADEQRQDLEQSGVRR
jgi:hypothetical protein